MSKVGKLDGPHHLAYFSVHGRENNSPMASSMQMTQLPLGGERRTVWSKLGRLYWAIISYLWLD